jgi:hypothetical protein
MHPASLSDVSHHTFFFAMAGLIILASSASASSASALPLSASPAAASSTTSKEAAPKNKESFRRKANKILGLPQPPTRSGVRSLPDICVSSGIPPPVAATAAPPAATATATSSAAPVAATAAPPVATASATSGAPAAPAAATAATSASVSSAVVSSAAPLLETQDATSAAVVSKASTVDAASALKAGAEIEDSIVIADDEAYAAAVLPAGEDFPMYAGGVVLEAAAVADQIRKRADTVGINGEHIGLFELVIFAAIRCRQIQACFGHSIIDVTAMYCPPKSNLWALVFGEDATPESVKELDINRFIGVRSIDGNLASICLGGGGAFPDVNHWVIGEPIVNFDVTAPAPIRVTPLACASMAASTVGWWLRPTAADGKCGIDTMAFF